MSEIFVIGHPRCGTTSLRHWLHQSPDVYLARADGKELQFFNSEYHRGLDWYESKHESLGKHLVDVNPNYSYVGFVARRIYENYPDAKILQVVRNPFERVYSWWRLFHNMRYGREPRSFEQFLFEDIQSYNPQRYLQEGKYLPYLDPSRATPYTPFILESGAYGTTRQRYVDLFGVESVRIIVFEDLIQDPLLWTNYILEWIGAETIDSIHNETTNVDDRWSSLESRGIAKTKHHWLSWQLEQIRTLYYSEINLLSKSTEIDFFEKWNLK